MTSGTGTPTDETEYVPKSKEASHRGTSGSTEAVELPDDAVGVTVDYESGLHGGGVYHIRYLVPKTETEDSDTERSNGGDSR